MRGRTVGLVAVLAAGFLDLLNVTVVNVALPTIITFLPASPGQAQGILTGYTLAFAVGLISGARLGRMFGLRRTFVAGTAGFAAASLGCGLSWSAEVLVAGRVLQGLCAAVMVPQVLALIQVMYPPEHRARPMAAFSGLLGAAASLGPIVGGVLVDLGDPRTAWRLVFLINVPIALAAAAVAAARVPEHRPAEPVRLDLPGVALAAAAAALLLGGLAGLANPGELEVKVVAVVAGVGLLVVFLAQQRAADRRGGSPLVPLALQGRGAFRAATVTQLLFFVPVMGFSLVLTQYVQTSLGYSPLAAGLLVLPWSVLVGVGAGLGTTVLLPRLGRVVVTVGLLVMAAGIGAVAGVVAAAGPGGPSWWALLPGIAVGGLGMGLVVAPLTEIALREVPVGLASEASGIYNSVGQLSAALGFATIGAVYFASTTAATGPADPVFAAATTTALLAGSGVAVLAAATTWALPRRAAPAASSGSADPSRW